MEDRPPVKHKKQTVGRKIKKKEKKNKIERYNPKAFSFSGGHVAVQRKLRRSLDILAKRTRAPRIDKTPPIDPPPVVVAIQGASGAGKSLLMKSLVRLYVKQTVTNLKGAVTIVSSRNRRITLIECSNSITEMLDVAKVADLIILVIDASLGLESDTFEMINILQVHGFPRIIGVLTHLDAFNDNKILKKTKSKLKHRFWAEAYDGAKLFNLTGVKNRRYKDIEIRNLARFIAIQKPLPLSFRSQHPHLLSLRCEPLEATGDATTSSAYFYGYVRGARLYDGMKVHIPGAGDFSIGSLIQYEDPCPLPDKPGSSKDLTPKLRTLKEQDRRVYAPAADIGSLRIDNDAMYISLPKTRIPFTPSHLITNEKTESESEGEADDASAASDDALSADLSDDIPDDDEEEEEEEDEDSDDGVGGVGGDSGEEGSDTFPVIDQESFRHPTPKSKSKEIRRVRWAGDDDEGSKTEAVTMIRELQNLDDSERGMSELHLVSGGGAIQILSGAGNRRNSHRRGRYADDQSDEELEIELAATRGVVERSARSLEDLVYGDRDDPLIAAQRETSTHILMRPIESRNEMPLFEDQPLVEDESAKIDNREESHVLSPWEFLEMATEGKMEAAPGDPVAAMVALLSFWEDGASLLAVMKEEEFTGTWFEEPKTEEPEATETKQQDETPRDATAQLKATEEEFRSQKDAEGVEARETAARLMEVQAFNDPTGRRGVAIGRYVRVEVVGVPREWLQRVVAPNGGHEAPVLLGGLLPGEESLNFIQCRVKRHRFSPRILKSQDPLLVSIGWRRFQVLPIYGIEERSATRHRYLKYTPEHMHCLAAFWGPVAPPNTGIVAFRDWRTQNRDYRISLTGTVLQCGPSIKFSKKLKLVGEPAKIAKNTAVVKNMFNSVLEVERCLGAKVQTPSGIRGQIKRPVDNLGMCRVSFEDQISMSDLVIMKAWTSIQATRYFNPMFDFATSWRPLRTIQQLRQQANLAIEDASAHDYKAKPERKPRRTFQPTAPDSLKSKLPFEFKPSVPLPPVIKEFDVVKSQTEKEEDELLRKLRLIKDHRDDRRLQNRNVRVKHNARAEAESMRRRGEALKKKKQERAVLNAKKRAGGAGMGGGMKKSAKSFKKK